MKKDIFGSFQTAHELIMIEGADFCRCFYPLFGPSDIDGAEQFVMQFLGQPVSFYAYTTEPDIGAESFLMDGPWTLEFVSDFFYFRRHAEPEFVQLTLEAESK
jgi:hypothetical protein